METDLISLIIALGAGGFVGYFARKYHALSQKGSIELHIRRAELEARERRDTLLKEAELDAERLKEEKQRDLKTLEEKYTKTEERLVKKEELLDQRQIDLDSQVEAVRGKIEEVKTIKARLDERAEDIDTEYERVASLTKEDAKKEVVARMEKDAEDDLTVRIQKLAMFGEEKLEERAKEIVITAIHRIGNTVRADAMTSSVEIPSDDLKGKIIGKEGRNVRAFERSAGVDVLIDESPGMIIISSFDPVRRQIAKSALENLIQDGRIQPVRIEEFVEKAKKEIATTMQKMGEKAAYEAGVINLHPDLIKILGRLHYRTSYGQNVLWHSVEMAHIAGMIAEEIGANVSVAKAGALLHDIGKAIDHEVQGSHVEIGRRILMKFGVDEAVVKAMQAHHEEYPFETPESIIVQVADAISGSRPGARRDSVENYIKRLQDLEAIATGFGGIEKAYAIQAGREVRVFVKPEEVNDVQAFDLAKNIARKIEADLKYPGEIRVNVIRESRTIEYAR
jgi:ribonucrease Y